MIVAFLLINKYNSQFDFLLNANFIKIRSLSVPFVSYTCENGRLFMTMCLLISRERKRKSKIDIDFKCLIWIEI